MGLEKLTADDFEGAFRILEASFPTDELRPREEQRALLERPEYSLCALRGEDGSIRGVIALWAFEGLVYVDHFAVNPEFRNGGIGSRMIGELVEAADDTICLEVEMPETDMARRRIGFYERNGFHLCECEYVQPPISEGKESLPMRIMTSRPVTEAGFAAIRDTLYSKVYGCTEA